MSASMSRAVKPLPPGEWHRRLHGPYVIAFQSLDTGAYEETQPSPSLEAALITVIDEPNYLNPDRRIAVLDIDGWIAFGYSTKKSYVEQFGHPAWWGSGLGFALLESLDKVDPVELAMMESVARDMSDGEGWWRHVED